MPTKTLTKKKTGGAKKATAKVVSKRTKVVPTPVVCSCNQACKPEHSFWVYNGPVVSSLSELRSAVEGMSDEQYQYHTARQGNDFAAWIRDCFGDGALAERVACAKNRAGALRVLGACCK